MNDTREKTTAEKHAELFQHHKEFFETLNPDDYVYKPKCFYHNKSHRSIDAGVLIIGFFKNELQKTVGGKDFYTEKVNIENYSEDLTRTLYMLPFDAGWADKYECIEEEGKATRYIVPVSDFEVISHIKVIKDDFTFDLANPDEDLPIDQMTIRDFYAIICNSPVSKKEFLNKLIRKNQ